MELTEADLNHSSTVPLPYLHVTPHLNTLAHFPPPTTHSVNFSLHLHLLRLQV